MLDDTVNILTDDSLEGISIELVFGDRVFGVGVDVECYALVNGFIVDIELEVARLGLSTVVS